MCFKFVFEPLVINWTCLFNPFPMDTPWERVRRWPPVAIHWAENMVGLPTGGELQCPPHLRYLTSVQFYIYHVHRFLLPVYYGCGHKDLKKKKMSQLRWAVMGVICLMLCWGAWEFQFCRWKRASKEFCLAGWQIFLKGQYELGRLLALNPGFTIYYGVILASHLAFLCLYKQYLFPKACCEY